MVYLKSVACGNSWCYPPSYTCDGRGCRLVFFVDTPMLHHIILTLLRNISHTKLPFWFLKVANNPGSCEEWYLGDEREGVRHGLGAAFFISGDVYQGEVRSKKGVTMLNRLSLFCLCFVFVLSLFCLCFVLILC